MKEEIIRNFLRKTEEMVKSEEGKSVTIDEDGIIRYFRDWNFRKLNGRHIRNTFQTALAIAEHKARESALDKNEKLDLKIGVEEFDYIGKSIKGFDDYIWDIVVRRQRDGAEKELLRLDN